MTQLHRDGRWDQGPLLASIERRKFPAILIWKPPYAAGVQRGAVDTRDAENHRRELQAHAQIRRNPDLPSQTKPVILSPFEWDGVRAADMRKPYRTSHTRGSGNPRVLKDEGSCAMALPLTWIWDIRQFYAASGSAVGGTSRLRSGGCDRREVGRGDRRILECLP